MYRYMYVYIYMYTRVLQFLYGRLCLYLALESLRIKPRGNSELNILSKVTESGLQSQEQSQD